MPERQLTLSYAEDESKAVQLFVDMGVGLGGDLWPATHHFCRFITSYIDRAYLQSIFDNKSVIELGSGTALTGLVVERFFSPREMIVSDLPSHIDLMQRNINLNYVSVCKAQEFDWSFPPDDCGKYDVIIALEW